MNYLHYDLQLEQNLAPIKTPQPSPAPEHQEPWRFSLDCPPTVIQLPAQFG